MVWGEAWGSPQAATRGPGPPTAPHEDPPARARRASALRSLRPPAPTHPAPAQRGILRAKGWCWQQPPGSESKWGLIVMRDRQPLNEPKGPGSWDLPQRARVARSRSCSIVVITSELDPLCDQTLAQSWFYRG